MSEATRNTQLAPKDPLLDAHPATSSVVIPIDGEDIEFSALLLRDMCQCPLCVHETTKQRLFSTADIPCDIVARDVCLKGGTNEVVSVSWAHDVPGFDVDHDTELRMNDLDRIAKSGTPRQPFQSTAAPQQLWSAANCDYSDFDYDDYMQDDATLYRALRQLRSHGLIVVKSCPGVEKSVSTIAERIGPVKDTFYGYTWDVRSVPAAINAAYTSQDLGFHTDLLYTQNPPHIQLLHCLQSSSIGGASVFVDAYKAAADLYHADREAFNILAETPVNYHYDHPGSNIYLATKPVIELRPLRVGSTTYHSLDDFLHAWQSNRSSLNQKKPRYNRAPALDVADCFEKINWGPPFQAPFSLGEETMERASWNSTGPSTSLNRKIEEWHSAARKFSGLLHEKEALHERLLQPGECVLFDNTRVLHGRKAFDAGDVGKPRWLRGTYVDKDPYMSKLRVLEDRFVEWQHSNVRIPNGN